MTATWYTVDSTGSIQRILGQDFLPASILAPVVQWCIVHGRTVRQDEDSTVVRTGPEQVGELVEDIRGLLAEDCSKDSMLRRFRIVLGEPGSYRDTASFSREDWVAALHVLESVSYSRILEVRITT